MITIGTCTNGTFSGIPSEGFQDENVVKNLVKKITFMVVAKLIPGHWCWPIPPGKKRSSLFEASRNREGLNAFGSEKAVPSRNAMRGSAVNT